MTSPIAGEREALDRIAGALRSAGANLPAPENKGTIESALLTGLSIALAVVEAERDAALLEPVGEGWQPTELEMHRADYKACRDAGWESPGELLAAYKYLAQQDNAKARRIDELTALLAPLPVAPKAEPTENEFAELQWKFEQFIDFATGGKLSKSSWALETLKAAVTEWNTELANLDSAPHADSAQPVADRSAEAEAIERRTNDRPFDTALNPHNATPKRSEEPNEWQEIDTLPQYDDLIWLYDQSRSSIEGPRRARPEDADWFTHWAPCEAPDTRAIDAAMGTPQQAEQGRPMTFEDRLRDLEEEDQMFEDRDMGDS